MDAYQEDLAYIHDVGFGGFAASAAPGLLHLLHRHSITDGLVVDLGCGSGIWARHLVDAGYEVLGVDLSAAMIGIARARVPEGQFQTGSFLTVPLPPCAAVTSLGECFNYLFDESNSLAQLTQLFRRVYNALRPGGLLVFDVAGPGRGAGPPKRHEAGDDWAVLVKVEEDVEHSRLTRRITTFRQVDSLYRRGSEVHQLRLHRPADIAAELRRAGFRVRTIRGYGALRFPVGWAGFVARKPPNAKD